jgi:addiction module HigA family antidote
MYITKRKPTHPGEILLEDVIKPLGLSVSEAAKGLGVSRKMLSQFVHGHSGLSPEMAVRIGIATNMSAERWLALQTRLDLWEAEQNRPKSIKPFKGIEELATI